MQIPNEYGVYLPTMTEQVARCGRVSAEVRLCQCEDRLFRFAVGFEYGMGGDSGPISNRTAGYATMNDARTAGIKELLWRFEKIWQSEGHSFETNREVAQVVARLKEQLAQPSFLDLLTG